MNLSLRTLSLMGLVFLDLYLKLNIMAFDAVSPYLWLLGVAILVMTFSAIWMTYGSRKIIFPEHAWVLCLFFAFYIFRLGVDYQSWGALKSGTIATTGGVVLFYLLGCLVLFNIQGLSRNSRGLPAVALTYSLLSFSFTGWVAVSFFADLREDLFLLANVDGQYQRAGGFMVCSLIIGFAVSHSLCSQSLKVSYVKVCSLLIFVLHCLFIAVLAQVLGSNNATVSALGVSVVSLMMLFGNSKMKLFSPPIPKITFLYFIQFVSLKGGKVVGLALLALFFLLAVTSVDITNTRLLGFGSGEFSSLSSRYELLANFPAHFSVSPIFGDLKSAALTTGDGSYVHSFIISIMTHLGLAGFVLFAVFMFLATSFLMSRNDDQRQLDGRQFRVYKFVLFSGLFLIACVGNFYTVNVIWFLIGVIFPCCVIQDEINAAAWVKVNSRV